MLIFHSFIWRKRKVLSLSISQSIIFNPNDNDRRIDT